MWGSDQAEDESHSVVRIRRDKCKREENMLDENSK